MLRRNKVSRSSPEIISHVEEKSVLIPEPSCDFSNMKIWGQDFSWSDITGGNLDDSSIVWSDFEGTQMQNTWMRGVECSGGNFTNANLKDSHIKNSLFIDSHFTAADIRTNYLSSCEFDRCLMRQSRVSSAKETTIFRSCEMEDMIF